MLKFFRKIRQKLIEEGRLKSYTFYAIGEILLVVLGILIALQIDTWNQNVQNDKQTKAYLTDLKTDLEVDIENLESYILQNQTRINNIDSITVSLIRKSFNGKKDKMDFLNRHFALIYETFFVPEKSTIRQIESTGHGVLIKNKQLRDHIFRYYTMNDKNEKNNEVSTQLYQHHFNTPAFMEALIDGDYAQLLTGSTMDIPSQDPLDFRHNKRYMAALYMRRSNCRNQNEYYGRILDMAKELLQMLDEELNKDLK